MLAPEPAEGSLQAASTGKRPSATSDTMRFTRLAFRRFTQASPARASKRPKMNFDSGERASTRCRSCGSDCDDRANASLEHLGKNYQVIVACASCRISFVALSRN
jgi:hypothetical protein